MILLMLLVSIVIIITYAIYRASTKKAQYFAERNLKYTPLSFSISNIFGIIARRVDIFKFADRHYNQFPEEKIYGAPGITAVQYVIRDPDVCKKLFVKDFDHFEDRLGFINENVDPLWGKSLISLHGEKWRQMRSTLSPTFTGTKMRIMFELVTECAAELVNHVVIRAEKGEKINVEMKDFFSRYTNDVIATCAFGIKVNSIAEPKNEFFMDVKKVFNFAGFKFMTALMFPSFARAFNIKGFDEAISNKFKAIILDTMDTREKNKISRPDMINILMQVRKGTMEAEDQSNETLDGFATVEESEIGKVSVIRKWNDDEVVAQCLIFLLAGFETSSSVLSFAAYELAINPDIQQKLCAEILELNEQLDGKSITYDQLQKMKYLDQVISETLRMYPPAAMIDRACVKDYIYDDGDKLNFKIEKDSSLIFSLYSVQNDPEYHPNPKRFDPDRFSDENKHKIIPGTYLPFGVGPRNCIGSRFALMELKAILYYLLVHFSFEVNENTQIPLRMKKGGNVHAEKGVHLELKPRLK